jgi:hypothetical protein
MAPAEAAAAALRMTLVNEALADIEAAETAGAVEARPAPLFPDASSGTGDDDTFAVDLLPAEAFEVLFLAAYGLGDILVADEPYLLELYLLDPAPCFCRLTLVPTAGGSIVTVDISPAADAPNAPQPAALISVLIAELEALVSG